MTKTQRHAAIVQMLETTPAMSVSELSGAFDVSPMTIRRDLDELKDNGKIIRIHGGAYATEKEPIAQISQRAMVNIPEKERIAKAAASLVKPGNSIILDGGSTVSMMASHLTTKEHLTVITPSLFTAQGLTSPNMQVLIPGGILLQSDFIIVGAECERFFQNMVADYAFVGATGIRPGRGISIVSPYQNSIKQTMMRSARKVVALVDHTKFERDALHLAADFKDIDIFITDRPISDKRTLDYMNEVGTEIIIAE